MALDSLIAIIGGTADQRLQLAIKLRHHGVSVAVDFRERRPGKEWSWACEQVRPSRIYDLHSPIDRHFLTRAADGSATIPPYQRPSLTAKQRQRAVAALSRQGFDKGTIIDTLGLRDGRAIAAALRSRAGMESA